MNKNVLVPLSVALGALGLGFLAISKSGTSASAPLDANLSSDQLLAIATAIRTEQNTGALEDFSLQLLPEFPKASAALHQRALELGATK